MKDQKEQFAHLLQPIRDLAENWMIDIAQELEEYLGEIDLITYSFDGAGNSLNFAQAALLIQGSACVYSRKVEYLYNLVYQTLELVSLKRKPLQSSVDEDGVDKDVNLQKEEDDELLTLDDLRESKDIDLREDDRFSRNRAVLLPRTPVAFWTHLDKSFTSSKVDLVSANGDIIGKRDDFKMNTSIIHDSGALILDSSDFQLMDNNLNLIPRSERIWTPSKLANKIRDNNHQNNQNNQNNNDENNHQRQDDSGFDFDDNDYGNNDENNHINNQNNNDENNNNIDNYDDNHLTINRPSWQSDTFGGFGNRAENESIGGYVDPWAMIDPHQTGAFPEKPFKKARIAKNVEKRRTVLGESQLMNNVNTFLNALQKSQKHAIPKTTIKAPLYPEFDYLFAKENKRRKALIQKEKEQLEISISRHDSHWTTKTSISNFDSSGNLDDHVDNFDDDFDNQGPMEYEENYHGNQPINDQNGNQPFMDDDMDGYTHPIRDEEFLAPIGLEEKDSNQYTDTYEDLCKLRIINYHAKAQKYDQELETSLNKRVREWEDKLKPLLHDQDKRPFFDVRAYGQNVIDCFQDKNLKKNDSLSLKEMVGEDPQVFHVVRMFMASLHLANSGNVDIKKEGSNMKVVLKSKVLHNIES